MIFPGTSRVFHLVFILLHYKTPRRDLAFYYFELFFFEREKAALFEHKENPLANSNSPYFVFLVQHGLFYPPPVVSIFSC